MRLFSAATILLFLGAIALFSLSVATSESEVGIFVIFPFIIADGPIALVAALLLIVGMAMIVIGFFSAISESQHEISRGSTYPTTEPKTEKRAGGVLLIGPIPIIFGSDSRMARSMLMLSIILVVVLIILFLVTSFLIL